MSTERTTMTVAIECACGRWHEAIIRTTGATVRDLTLLDPSEPGGGFSVYIADGVAVSPEELLAHLRAGRLPGGFLHQYGERARLDGLPVGSGEWVNHPTR